MKLKHYIKKPLTHSFIQTVQNWNEMHNYFLSKDITYRKYLYLQEDEVRRNLFEHHLQRINIKILLSDISKIRTKKQNMLQWKGAHHRRLKKVAPLPSARTNELHANDQYANEREQPLLVWVNNELEVGQLIFCLAAESAAELALMPTWPGTQTKTIPLSSWINCD